KRPQTKWFCARQCSSKGEMCGCLTFADVRWSFFATALISQGCQPRGLEEGWPTSTDPAQSEPFASESCPFSSRSEPRGRREVQDFFPTPFRSSSEKDGIGTFVLQDWAFHASCPSTPSHPPA